MCIVHKIPAKRHIFNHHCLGLMSHVWPTFCLIIKFRKKHNLCFPMLIRVFGTPFRVPACPLFLFVLQESFGRTTINNLLQNTTQSWCIAALFFVYFPFFWCIFSVFFWHLLDFWIKFRRVWSSRQSLNCSPDCQHCLAQKQWKETWIFPRFFKRGFHKPHVLILDFRKNTTTTKLYF